MNDTAPAQLEVLDVDAWPTAPPQCVERVVPEWGSTWVHAYTLADWDRIRLVASSMSGVPFGEDPGRETLRLAQMIFVCRTAPGAVERTFVVPAGAEAEAYPILAQRLPRIWVEQVCAESDALALSGYVPTSKRDNSARESARRSLREALSDRQTWVALEVLSLKLYGKPLTDNGAPIAHVLEVFESHAEAQEGLVSMLGVLNGV